MVNDSHYNHLPVRHNRRLGKRHLGFLRGSVSLPIVALTARRYQILPLKLTATAYRHHMVNRSVCRIQRTPTILALILVTTEHSLTGGSLDPIRQIYILHQHDSRGQFVVSSWGWDAIVVFVTVGLLGST